jgi:hypothetical protein
MTATILLHFLPEFLKPYISRNPSDHRIAIRFLPRLGRGKKIILKFLAPIIESRRALDEESKPVSIILEVLT